MAKPIIVTGSWLVNFRLSRLPEKVQKKVVKKACRESAKKVVLPKVKESIRAQAYDSGAMHDAVKVRATSRNILGLTGKVKEFTKRDGTIGRFTVVKTIGQEFGAKVEISRKDLNKQLAKRGLTEINDGDYFYPAAVELGASDEPPQKPIQRTIPAARQPTRSMLVQELAKLIRNPK